MKVEVEIPKGGLCNRCRLLGEGDKCNWLNKNLEWDDIGNIKDEIQIVWFKHPDCPSLKEKKLRFGCNRCPASFAQFKELVEHYEDKHTKEGDND